MAAAGAFAAQGLQGVAAITGPARDAASTAADTIAAKGLAIFRDAVDT